MLTYLQAVRVIEEYSQHAEYLPEWARQVTIALLRGRLITVQINPNSTVEHTAKLFLLVHVVVAVLSSVDVALMFPLRELVTHPEQLAVCMYTKFFCPNSTIRRWSTLFGPIASLSPCRIGTCPQCLKMSTWMSVLVLEVIRVRLGMVSQFN